MFSGITASQNSSQNKTCSSQDLTPFVRCLIQRSVWPFQFISSFNDYTCDHKTWFSPLMGFLCSQLPPGMLSFLQLCHLVALKFENSLWKKKFLPQKLFFTLICREHTFLILAQKTRSELLGPIPTHAQPVCDHTSYTMCIFSKV